ncbi:CoA-substrate-specific enzyme activase, putative [Tissierella praeacuta DSM 18095]|uniref:CoA-substrate-specific enzyme activase, putative n=1 Tax=Tissierella praeacuta DSM 18095 TaxID=1123404 RepID=A0A1M4VJS2_9FIRM|nr:acyl-CoA dehydratase activase [Tissierella praeacuta]TCU79281.1 putative CoA-substrate-specific enzyme activase [Tissierella praeacuta]SHE69326.1 CoA-substrate-specific enzyme activase, putative [Tissierella praeacuta DSM 18095]SUO99101.1 2-hydroxyglutaryl-CoA dehydratase component A [Tissierella praeacuta]
MHYIGIDIGSTAAKVSVFNDIDLMENFTMPTGWSSIETSKEIKERLEKSNIEIDKSKVIATGYGRISVPYADKTITEITCHGKGTHYLLGKDCTVIDIGGQDTKIITLEKGKVSNFTMNDKCAAGTGRFLELMANTLGVSIDELGRMALSGEDINITSMCTVFAESEVISLIGSGTKRESIARGIVNSITGRVYALLHKHGATDTVFLTGGLCEVESFTHLLSEKLGVKVQTSPLARYAGSIGAALLSKDI